ncbi:MAG TPA: hypothetical protein DCP28_29855, partial [Cytophagales bacterium]|nr:hypothetical protein [Cytophagales bacterium]
EAAAAGDLLAIEAFDRTGTILGQAMADLAAAFNPEAFIIAGGLAKAGNMLYEPARKALQENLLSNIQNDVQVLPSSLEENDMALLGASALVWKHQSLNLDELPDRSVKASIMEPVTEGETVITREISSSSSSHSSSAEIAFSQNQILP